MRIPLPNRQASASDQSPVAPVNVNPLAIEQNARAKFVDTVDNVLSRIIPGIVLESKRIQVRSEITEGQVEYGERMEQATLDVYKNPDIGSWPKLAQMEHQKIMADIMKRDISPRAKEQLSLIGREQWSRRGVEISLHSKRLIAENERAQLPRTMMSFVRQRDKEGFTQLLDQMMEGDPGNLLPQEKENWLEAFDKAESSDAVRIYCENQAFEEARTLVKTLPDTELREQLNNKIDGYEAANERKTRYEKMLKQEQTYSTFLANYWDGSLVDPSIVTSALREGTISPEAGSALLNAINKKDARTHSDLGAIAEIEQMLLKFRSETVELTDVLNTIAVNAGKLSATDGKSYLQEAFGEQDKVNADWDRRAFEYIEDQILNVASLTGIKYGTGEQKALVGQAIIKYNEAKRLAASQNRPYKTTELLSLAHEIMIPFREHVQPLIKPKPGEGAIPQVLTTTPLGIPFSQFLTGKGPQPGDFKGKRKDMTVEEFESTFDRIQDRDQRLKFYNTYYKEVYGQ